MKTVAVLTGGHPYDVPAFNACLRSLPGIDCHVQSVQEFCTNFGGYTDCYDAVVFFAMELETPADAPAWNTIDKASLEAIAKRGQGIVVLHHAVLAFPEWDMWTDVTGIPDRKNYQYAFGRTVRSHIEHPGHPITRGLEDWDLVDETYDTADPGEGSDILLSTPCTESLGVIAWTRHYRNAKVFCYQSGHDRAAYEDPHFRTVLARGILWTCGEER
jgi:type 1 glutamine amidotransferase